MEVWNERYAEDAALEAEARECAYCGTKYTFLYALENETIPEGARIVKKPTSKYCSHHCQIEGTKRYHREVYQQNRIKRIQKHREVKINELTQEIKEQENSLEGTEDLEKLLNLEAQLEIIKHS